MTRPVASGRPILAEPFTFAGFPNREVYLHGCGTALDVAPGDDTYLQMMRGECDCETFGPWYRVYVRPDECLG